MRRSCESSSCRKRWFMPPIARGVTRSLPCPTCTSRWWLRRLGASGTDGAWEAAPQGTYDLLTTPIVFNGHYHTHFYPRLERLLQQLQPSVLHVDEEPHNLATFQFVAAGEATRDPRALLRAREHRYAPAAAVLALREGPFRWSARAIAGSESAPRRLQARGYRRPVDVIPHFEVDPDTSIRSAPAWNASRSATWATSSGQGCGRAGRGGGARRRQVSRPHHWSRTGERRPAAPGGGAWTGVENVV